MDQVDKRGPDAASQQGEASQLRNDRGLTREPTAHVVRPPEGTLYAKLIKPTAPASTVPSGRSAGILVCDNFAEIVS